MTTATLTRPGKTCSSCKWWKPSEQFYQEMRRWDGRASQCKACTNKPKPAEIIQFERSRRIREQRLPMLRAVLAKLRQSTEASQ